MISKKKVLKKSRLPFPYVKFEGRVFRQMFPLTHLSPVLIPTTRCICDVFQTRGGALPLGTLLALGEIRNVPSLLSGGQFTTCSHDDDYDNEGGSVIGTGRCVRGRTFTQEVNVDYTVGFPQFHIYNKRSLAESFSDALTVRDRSYFCIV